MTMRPHVIQQGEYLTRLAHTLGFDADEVWNHPRNRELREQRPSADQLCPGDVVHVPERAPEGPAFRPHQSNRFRAARRTVRVSVVLHAGDEPMANEPYVVEGLGATATGTADGDGRVTLEVPVHVSEVRLLLPRRRTSMPVRVGHADPIAEPSGVRQRLEHLGFYGFAHGHPGDAHPPTEDDDRRAIEAFQRRAGLRVTGQIDDATRTAIESAHGG